MHRMIIVINIKLNGARSEALKKNHMKVKSGPNSFRGVCNYLAGMK
jgi:hypothetical protein